MGRNLPVSRRELLGLGALGALRFVLPCRAEDLERAVAGPGGATPRKALLMVWLEGGPSQLETFDPHPGRAIAGPTRGIKTSIPGVELGADYPRLAERLHHVSLVRSLVSTEGEHSRGSYILRTGYAPLPTVRRPTLGAIAAHELPRDGLELPRHVAFLASAPPQGGFLGPEVRGFVVGDPRDPLQDLTAPVGEERQRRRLEALDVLESEFRRGREAQVDATSHAALARRGVEMMTTPQQQAFAFAEEPAATVEAYGDSAFGRSCLVARRLIEAGVPAVEVVLSGWDSHADNFGIHTRLAGTLDRALSALLDDLVGRDLLRSTVIACGGEFGRTPRINGLGGRDHWTKGFSWLVGGGGLRGEQCLGATDPAGERGPSDPVAPADLSATLLEALGIDRARDFTTPQGRPVVLNEGTPLARLMP